LELAYPLYCQFRLDGTVQDHSTFSKTNMVASATVACCRGRSRPSCSVASTRPWSAARLSVNARLIATDAGARNPSRISRANQERDSA
jgi:hypothetical protein